MRRGVVTRSNTDVVSNVVSIASTPRRSRVRSSSRILIVISRPNLALVSVLPYVGSHWLRGLNSDALIGSGADCCADLDVHSQRPLAGDRDIARAVTAASDRRTPHHVAAHARDRLH